MHEEYAFDLSHKYSVTRGNYRGGNINANQNSKILSPFIVPILTSQITLTALQTTKKPKHQNTTQNALNVDSLIWKYFFSFYSFIYYLTFSVKNLKGSLPWGKWTFVLNNEDTQLSTKNCLDNLCFFTEAYHATLIGKMKG